MIRYLVRNKKVEKKFDHPLFGSGTFVKEVKDRPVLQYMDAEGNWCDVKSVEEECNDGA